MGLVAVVPLVRRRRRQSKLGGSAGPLLYLTSRTISFDTTTVSLGSNVKKRLALVDDAG